MIGRGFYQQTRMLKQPLKLNSDGCTVSCPKCKTVLMDRVIWSENTRKIVYRYQCPDCGVWADETVKKSV